MTADAVIGFLRGCLRQVPSDQASVLRSAMNVLKRQTHGSRRQEWKQRVLAALGRSPVPMAAGAIGAQVPELPASQMKPLLRELRDEGAIVMSGFRAGARYQLSRARRDQPKPAKRATVARVQKVTSRVTRDQLSMTAEDQRKHIVGTLKDGKPRTLAQLFEPVRDRCGYASFRLTVGFLKSLGTIEQSGGGAWGKPYILGNGRSNMPAVRDIPVPPRDPARLSKIEARIDRLLASGASYDMGDIIRNTRAAVPDVTSDDVRPVMDRRVSDGAVRVIVLLSTRRYQLVIPDNGDRD